MIHKIYIEEWLIYRVVQRTAQTIIYDGTCKFCQKQLHRIILKDENHLFTYVSSSHKDLPKLYGITKEQAMKGIIFIDEKGKRFQEAPAIQQIYMRLNSSHIFAWGRKIPLIKQCIDYSYKLLARHRYKLYGRCEGECVVKK